MQREELIDAFLSSLDDRRLSRSERRALSALLEEDPPDHEERRMIEARLFEEVGQRLSRKEDRELLHGLRVALGRLHSAPRQEQPSGGGRTRVWFGPEAPMWETLCDLIRGSDKSIDVAVFTITDDRVSKALVDAHRRGIRVRVLSDNDKSGDRGSDIVRLGKQGLAVALDRSHHHFHHKFAIFDGRSVLTGSYNWTRGAANSNRENFMLTWDPIAVEAFTRGFERLWKELSRPG